MTSRVTCSASVETDKTACGFEGKIRLDTCSRNEMIPSDLK